MTECVGPGLIWAPIRHHSPQCAWQLRRLLEATRPDVVLIEAPVDGNALLPLLQDARTRAPVALFLHAPPRAAGAVQARCFVPMAAMSPEWVALREAARLGIAARFIDLPFLARAQQEPAGEDLAALLEPPASDERPLLHSPGLAALLAASGCEDFEALWERSFESGVEYPSAETFFQRLMDLGLLLREDSGIDAQTRAREVHMAAMIRQARAAGQRCLVVCGAFHCGGILEHLAAPNPPVAELAAEAGVHLVAYSLRRLNATHHYAAGIPDCAYQAKVWSLLARRRESAGAVHPEVQASLVAELIGQLRERGYPATFPDASEALVMTQRLGALRGHRAGRRELRESLLGCLLKQARDGSERPLLEEIDRFFAGGEVGRLPPGVPLAPLVQDFREHCRRMRLPRSAGAPLERTLDLYRNAAHREQSRLLNRLASLEVPFATRLAGPRFAVGEDLQRVRERWSLSWVPETEACLTERSHYGARLLDAATARCRERMEQARREGRECASLLVDALAMGLHELLAPLVMQVSEWLEGSHDFAELCRALLRLDAARHARTALQGPGLEQLDALLARCFQRICLELAWLGVLPPDHEDEVADALVNMVNLLLLETPGCDADAFFEALQMMLHLRPTPLLAGLAHGALLGSARMDIAQAAQALAEIGGQAGLDAQAPGQFLDGLLRLARQRLLQEPALQAAISQMLLGWEEDTFLAALPGVRLAFTRYSPRQLAELAAQVMPGGASMPIARAGNWASEDLLLAAQLRKYLAQARQAWDGVRDE